MTCEQFRDRLTAFSLGELEPQEAVAAREHVTRCSACASRALLDRQLTALVRSTAVTTPDTVRVRIMSALRTEAHRPGQRNRRRHWLSLGAAAGLAAAVLAAAMLLVPSPAPASPLTAAWTAYRTERLVGHWDRATQARLISVLGAAAETPNLGHFGFRVVGGGGSMLAGHLAAVTEYRDMAGHRVTFIRWRGDLPRMASARGPGNDGVDSARWGPIGSIWWSGHGIVYCLIGGVDQQVLYTVTEHLQHGGGG
ncbi:MAG TPA: zf-HC2 domain-containing protein [Actinomycetota bacterium]|jgi:anti-sigma factor RsiW|nr:zf-HC2 domain-containing protein [Actinomycetota bacterium]